MRHYIRQRPNGRWEAQVSLGFSADGTRIRRSISAASEAELHARINQLLAPVYTVGDLLDAHLVMQEHRAAMGLITLGTLYGWQYAAKRVGPLRDTAADTLTVSQAAAWAASLKGSPSTRRKTFQVVAGAFRGRDHNPFADLPAPSGKTSEAAHATAGDVATILARSQFPWKALWTLLAYTGMRPGEARCLRWEHVDLHIGSARILAGKTVRSVRQVPLLPIVVDCLTQFAGECSSAWLFPGRSGPVDRWTMNRAFRKVAPPGLKPHSLRHGVATRLLTAGIPVHEVAAILGHSSPSVTLDTYAHSVPTGRISALEVLTVGSVSDFGPLRPSHASVRGVTPSQVRYQTAPQPVASQVDPERESERTQPSERP